MTTPEREPQRGELWASPTGDEFLVIAGLDGSRWLARPVGGADLTGWTLAQEADPGDPGYIAVPADNLGLRPATGGVRGTMEAGQNPANPANPVTSTARLIQRLREVMPDLPANVEFRRTYASAADRNAGAWSWSLHDPANPRWGLGSQWPVGTLLAAASWYVSGPDQNGDISIDPGSAGVAPPGARGTTRTLRTPDAEPQPDMAVWTKPDGTSGTIPAADLDAFARYAATLRPGEPGWKHGTIAVDAAKLPSLAGQQVASAAEIKAGLDSAARKPITVDGPAEHDAPLTATCPYCGAHNQIAEINEASQTAPLEFYRGTDNDGVYGSAPDADLNIPAVAYLCTACGRGVSVPLDITLTQ